LPENRPARAFWTAQTDEIEWFNKANDNLSKDEMDITMNKEGELNICYLALDKHIQDGYGDQVANI
jgi:propionyl-CoA synthetase